MNIPDSDVHFIKTVLMPWARVQKLFLAQSMGTAKFPDIWVEMDGVPKITVTQEWLRQSPDERGKRLTHEFLHLRGLQHDERIGYSTYPNRDTYSQEVYQDLITRNPYPPAGYDWRKLQPDEPRRTAGKLPIAPAYTKVYLNKDPSARLEAVAKDSVGRTIYLYAKKFRQATSVSKFRRVRVFAAAHPSIMKRVERDFPRREEAKILYLIDKTMFRVGGEGDTRAKVKAFGATTLTSRHVNIDGDEVRFDFIGKTGVHQVKTIKDHTLATELRKRYVEGRDTKIFDTNEGKVIGYLRSLPRGKGLKVSDFRPFFGTQMARQEIASRPIPTTKKAFKTARKEIATKIAAELGNTPGVTLSSYIDPKVWEPWEEQL